MYNPTCLITGKNDNLRMHPLRNKDNNMIGWVFLHESILIKDINASLNWEYKFSVRNELDGQDAVSRHDS